MTASVACGWAGAVMQVGMTNWLTGPWVTYTVACTWLKTVMVENNGWILMPLTAPAPCTKPLSDFCFLPPFFLNKWHPTRWLPSIPILWSIDNSVKQSPCLPCLFPCLALACLALACLALACLVHSPAFCSSVCPWNFPQALPWRGYCFYFCLTLKLEEKNPSVFKETLDLVKVQIMEEWKGKKSLWNKIQASWRNNQI